MNTEEAAKILLGYVLRKTNERQQPFNAVWYDLSRQDPKFRGMLKGYQNIRRKEGHRER